MDFVVTEATVKNLPVSKHGIMYQDLTNCLTMTIFSCKLEQDIWNPPDAETVICEREAEIESVTSSLCRKTLSLLVTSLVQFHTFAIIFKSQWCK